MKENSKNKGFTLVELLAVIVVLAIVMVIAAVSVGPIIDNARKGAFASSGNSIISAVESAVASDEILGTTKTCYTVAELIDNGYLRKIEKAPASNPTTGYAGKVTVTKSGANYTYAITLYDYKTKYTLSDIQTIPIVAGDVTTVQSAPAVTCP